MQQGILQNSDHQGMNSIYPTNSGIDFRTTGTHKVVIKQDINGAKTT